MSFSLENVDHMISQYFLHDRKISHDQQINFSSNRKYSYY